MQADCRATNMPVDAGARLIDFIELKQKVEVYWTIRSGQADCAKKEAFLKAEMDFLLA